jgi:hypothetical protein
VVAPGENVGRPVGISTVIPAAFRHVWISASCPAGGPPVGAPLGRAADDVVAPVEVLAPSEDDPHPASTPRAATRLTAIGML